MTHDVPIRGPSIRLGQLLKLINAIEGGGEAKAFLAAHTVDVNGAAEDRRGRQLHPGDVVHLDGHAFRVVAA